MMKILVATLLVYALGLLFTAVGSRLAGRCTTWCCALLGLPMWVVGGTVAPFCLALPQLMLAFLAAGMSVTALAVGTALAGAVTNLGLALSVCLLRKRHCAVADRDEFCRKCLLLLAACLTAAATLTIGPLSFVGLMAPHIARMMGFRRTLPHMVISGLTGGLLLVFADWCGRMMMFPYQIPAGLLSTFIGAPYFIYLLRKQSR